MFVILFSVARCFAVKLLGAEHNGGEQVLDIKSALKEQYHGGLRMLSDCVEKCPDDLWAHQISKERDEERWCIRSYWRIAFHTAFFTHLYLAQKISDFQPWPARRQEHEQMWHEPWPLEPYEMAEDTTPYSKQEIQAYIEWLDSIIDPTVDTLDLAANETGIPWYKNMSKLSHEMMNIRHIQGHVGQLSELLMQRGIDIDWVARWPRP